MSPRRQIFDALTAAMDVLSVRDPERFIAKWDDPLTADELAELGAASLEIAASVGKLAGMDVFTFSQMARTAFMGSRG